MDKFNDVSFNQDGSCFSVASNEGFKIFNTYPLQCKLVQSFESANDNSNTDKGLGLTQMLNRSNYIALVGGGERPRYPLNRLVIWDDLQGARSVTLNFMSAIRQVLLSRCFIIVVLASKISVYSFGKAPQKLLDDLDIPAGSQVDYSSVAKAPNSGILCFESKQQRGQVHVMQLQDNSSGASGTAGQTQAQSNMTTTPPATTLIKAHKSPLRLVRLNHQGTMVATCSHRGTLIRVFSVQNGTLLHEFRRGSDPAEVYDMQFSPQGTFLAVVSSKQTLHIFQVVPGVSPMGGVQEGSARNESHDSTANRRLTHTIPKKWGASLGLGYLDSVWSMCSVHLRSASTPQEERAAGTQGIPDPCKIGWCGPAEDSVVLVWKHSGVWEKYVILESSAAKQEQGQLWEIVRESWREL